MAAPTDVYCDPSIGGSSGSGTIGDPYSGVQYALNTMARDATNGNRVNVIGGGTEVLSSELALSGYGLPTITAPLIIQGCTATAGDGGKGAISGGGVTSIRSTVTHYLSFIDLHLHNTGANNIVNAGGRATISRCEFSNTTGNAIDSVSALPDLLITDSHFHDIGGHGVNADDALVWGCHFENGVKEFISGVRGTGSANVKHCTFTLSGASHGIQIAGGGTNASNNSILSDGGTGHGIDLAANGMYGSSVLNNLIEGFSGTGGAGVAFGNNTRELNACGHNAVFNCVTAYENRGDCVLVLGDDETLSESPFAKSGSNTFANRGVYFAPNDTSNVRSGAFPLALRLDKGAIQSSGGGTTVVQRHVFGAGGMTA